MSILHDATASSSAFSTSLAFDLTIGGGDNRGLAVGIGAHRGSDITISVTYNSVAMTQARSDHNGTGDASEIWIMDETDLPAAGTYSVSISVDGSSTSIMAGATSVTGVNQSGIEANDTGSTSSGVSEHNLQITTVVDGAWVFQTTHSEYDGAIAPDDGQTERWEENRGGTRYTNGCTLEVASAGTTDIGCSWGGNDYYTASAISWAPAIDDNGVPGSILIPTQRIHRVRGR